jgi:hypothetical protein
MISEDLDLMSIILLQGVSLFAGRSLIVVLLVVVIIVALIILLRRRR